MNPLVQSLMSVHCWLGFIAIGVLAALLFGLLEEPIRDALASANPKWRDTHAARKEALKLLETSLRADEFARSKVLHDRAHASAQGMTFFLLTVPLVLLYVAANAALNAGVQAGIVYEPYFLATDLICWVTFALGFLGTQRSLAARQLTRMLQRASADSGMGGSAQQA